MISLFCGCSFGIYLIHILFLDNYKKYMEAADLTAWAAVPVLTAGITLVSFVCVAVICFRPTQTRSARSMDYYRIRTGLAAYPRHICRQPKTPKG